jgi:hypothetical protein
MHALSVVRHRVVQLLQADVARRLRLTQHGASYDRSGTVRLPSTQYNAANSAAYHHTYCNKVLQSYFRLSVATLQRLRRNYVVLYELC